MPGRRDEVLALAGEAFFARGYDATSTRDLARGLGILGGSLYHHIDSKESLLFEIVRESFGAGVVLVEELRDGGGTAPERLRRLVRGHVAALAAHTVPIGLMFHEADALSPAHAAVVGGHARMYVTAVRTALEDGRAAGELRPELDPTVAAHHVLGAMNWMYRWYRDDGRLPADAVGRGMATLLVDGLGAPPAAGRADAGALAERGLAVGAAAPAATDRDRVLGAAAELFAQRGVAGTSMQDIASAVAMRKAGLYGFVASKEQLLYELADGVLARTLAATDVILRAGADPLTRLAAVMECQAAVIAGHPAQTRLILHERRALAPEHERALEDGERRFHGDLVTLLEEARGAQLVAPDRDLRLAALCALGSVNWTYRWHRPGGRLSGREVGRQLAGLLRDGLVAR